MIYKTEQEIKRDSIRKKANMWRFVQTCILSIILGLTLVLWLRYSIHVETENKALNEVIQACEAKPPCKRELEK